MKPVRMPQFSIQEGKQQTGYRLLGLLYVLLALFCLSQIIVFVLSGGMQYQIPGVLFGLIVPFVVLFLIQPIIWFLKLRAAKYTAEVIQILFLLTSLKIAYQGLDMLISVPAIGFILMGLLVFLTGLTLIIINYLILRYIWKLSFG